MRDAHENLKTIWFINIYSTGALWMSSWFSQEGGSIRAS
jgi:hypothetical protein